MSVIITTNHHPRPLLAWYDLSDAERSNHDHEGAEEGVFFRYKKWAYSLGDFLRVPDDARSFAGWDACSPNSYFSGTLVRLTDDDDVVVGSWYVAG